jgi:hypothetical protein
VATIDTLDAFTAETVVAMLVKAAGNKQKIVNKRIRPVFFHPATKDEFEDFKSLVAYLRAY